jgi:P-type conjugative transfer protein TrbJ
LAADQAAELGERSIRRHEPRQHRPDQLGWLADALAAFAGQNRTQMSALVSSSQSATGALQAAQAGNQILALQAQQLADLTAAVAAQGRAQSLQGAQQAAAEDQGKEQMRRFLTPGSGYQPTAITMFH